MGAGIAGQQTVVRDDSIPLGPWEGLGVVAAYAAVALVMALWAIRAARRLTRRGHRGGYVRRR